jgi:hypothetical protein
MSQKMSNTPARIVQCDILKMPVLKLHAAGVRAVRTKAAKIGGNSRSASTNSAALLKARP